MTEEVKELREEVKNLKGLQEKQAMHVIYLKNAVEEVKTHGLEFAKIEEIKKEVKESSILANRLSLRTAEDYTSFRSDVSTMKQEMCDIMSELIKVQKVMNGSGAVNNQVESEGTKDQNRADPNQVQEVRDKSQVEGTQSDSPNNGESPGWNNTEDSVEERQVQEAIEKSLLELRKSQEPSRKEIYERLTLVYSEKHPETLMQFSDMFEGRSA